MQLGARDLDSVTLLYLDSLMVGGALKKRLPEIQVAVKWRGRSEIVVWGDNVAQQKQLGCHLPLRSARTQQTIQHPSILLFFFFHLLLLLLLHLM